uniref:Protein cereblon n=1 Tax=Tetraselmis sp. GSL018 TaxID=582737 RepID=A0A061RY02_9CHLO|mmetsp:Transcript_7096/g.17042  ORF Transcript_7096/g.17042 Transcript_7096/m.17042 type:complete len:437 (+) Transcript_7096:138-1448(+)
MEGDLNEEPERTRQLAASPVDTGQAVESETSDSSVLEALSVSSEQEFFSEEELVLQTATAAQVTPTITFDTSQAAAHTYLGDREDLSGTSEPFGDGETVGLPLYPISDLVLFPGGTLPLRLDRRQRELVDRALAAAPPLQRLIAVICFTRPFDGMPHFSQVGCTAEVRQVREDDDGSLNCIAIGQQRIRVSDKALRESIQRSSWLAVPVKVMADAPVPPVPREARRDMMWWGRLIFEAFDPHALAATAKGLAAAMSPQARLFEGSPLQLSYWLGSNMPFDADVKQEMLEVGNEVERLRCAIRVMEPMDPRCRFCGVKISSGRNVFSMSESGPGGAFVNPQGYIHDLMTVSKVSRNVALHGRPETEYSWFPGYAWTICCCSTCSSHLGWRFTATKEGLLPRSFWGLRVSQLMPRVKVRGSDGDSPSHEPLWPLSSRG